MALKQISCKFVVTQAENAIRVLQDREETLTQYKLRDVIENWKKKWFSRLFRKDWTDEQFMTKSLSHTRGCHSLWCNLDYPSRSTVWSKEIIVLNKLKNLAFNESSETMLVTEDDYKLLTTY